MKNYDVIIIGAGSVGTPIAMNLAAEKLNVLVIEKHASAGQGENKKAIGGIRATHSDESKIQVALRSIEIFSTWKETYGDDIEWLSNGYSFPAYTEEHEAMLKDLLKVQKTFGLNIDWISAEEYQDLVPGINSSNLRGATYSPKDGSASPLLSQVAFYRQAKKHGTEFVFQENVESISQKEGQFIVQTSKEKYAGKKLINAAGSQAKEIAAMVGIELPVKPDKHEGAITEAVQRFMGPMVVDLRPSHDSANYYFYQNAEGQVVFCITPQPSIWGEDTRSTSVFLPQVAKRMVQLYPRLKNLKVRRCWRGHYPMTPDGFPIVEENKDVPNFINVVGMCGQGFMLGPGIGELVSRMVTEQLSDHDHKILHGFRLERDFSGVEKFK